MGPGLTWINSETETSGSSSFFNIYRTGERLGKLLRVIERELRRSFADSSSAFISEPLDDCQTLFTANTERSCAQADHDYQLGQVVY